MKKVLYLFMALVMLVSCGPKRTVDTAATNTDSLMSVIEQRDSVINDIFTEMDAIAENLHAIKLRENIINNNMRNGEIQPGNAARINQDIQSINQLLIENRETITRLQNSARDLKDVNINMAGLEKLIAQLQRQVEEKDQEITLLKGSLLAAENRIEGLNEQVLNLNTTVSVLTDENVDLIGEVKSQGDMLNTGYYIVGAEKELLSKEIIYKSGFIGRTLKINENRSLENFTQVDIRSFDEVIVGQKKVTVISSHPAGSYDIVMDSNGVVLSLKITDREKFWEYSKVLVVAYK